MANTAGFGAIRRALSHPNCRNYMIGASINNMGTWVHRVAAGWLAWELSGSATWLGLIAFASMGPAFLLAPWTGAVADRFDRKFVIQLTQVLACVAAAATVVLAALDAMTVEVLFVMTLLHGVCVAFTQPARMAIIPALVPRSDLTAAIGLNAFQFNIARMIGPMISSGLIAAFGVAYAFAFNALSYLVMIGAMLLITFDDRPPSREERRRRGMWADIIAGYRYAIGHYGIGRLLLLQLSISLFARPFQELLPGFADVVFQRGVHGLGILISAMGFGAALGGLAIARRDGIAGLISVAVGFILILSLALMTFALVQTFWLAVVCLAIAGYALIHIGIAQQTLIQNAVDPAMRGRIIGLYGMINRGGPALGALSMGAAAELVGLQAPVAIGASLCLVIFVWARRWRGALADQLEVEPA